MKKFYLAILAVLFPFSMIAQEVETTANGIPFILDTNLKTAKVKGGNPYTGGYNYYGDLIIPPVIRYIQQDYVVTEISPYAFANVNQTSGITSISIPNTVSFIGGSAFGGCDKLKSIILPPALTELVDDAFNGCSNLVKVAAPYVVNNSYHFESNPAIVIYDPNDVLIDNGWVYDENKTKLCFAPIELDKIDDVVLPETVKSIGTYAFAHYNAFNSLTFPEGLETVESDAFYINVGDYRMINHFYAPGASPARAFNDTFNWHNYAYTTLHVPADSESLYKSATAWKDFKYIEADIVKEDPNDFFYNGIWYTVTDGNAMTCKTKELGQDEVQEGKRANVVSGKITIPEKAYNSKDGKYYTVNYIGSYSFYDAVEMTYIELPNTIQIIGREPFANSGLKSIILPPSFTNGPGLNSNFAGCAYLQKVAVSDYHYTPSIGDTKFIVYPRETAIIENGWVYGENYEELYFAPLELENSVTLPENLKTIHSYAFYGFTFAGTQGKLYLPTGLNNVEEDAFANGSGSPYSLWNIYYPRSNPRDIAHLAFSWSNYNQTTLNVPVGSIDRFKEATGWKNFKFIQSSIEDDASYYVTDGIVSYVFMIENEERDISTIIDIPSTRWTSSDEEIATISTNGIVYAKKFGKTVVTAFNNDTEVATIEVLVCPEITVVYPEGAAYKHPIAYNTHAHLYIEPTNGWEINTVTHTLDSASPRAKAAGTSDSVYGEITDQIVNNYYTSAEPIKENSTITVSLAQLEDNPTGVPSVSETPDLKMFVDGLTLTIIGADDSAQVQITNLSGQTVYTGTEKTIKLSDAGVYIVKVASSKWIYKIVMH